MSQKMWLKANVVLLVFVGKGSLVCLEQHKYHNQKQYMDHYWKDYEYLSKKDDLGIGAIRSY